ncbi:DUF3237 domain-containing protein [Mesorhizobium sp. B2-4-12]|uniref:DUF3237 domain-containing protein n=1 Tax=unclassified Mesorhizobium TaxID=325217 RepID=UPI001127CC87|nr:MULTISPECIES: DUF3237 domain-containing protein [unclassified Mesorhizobium]TPK95031.1 DUF3237 domain-containing protein [Mesorhizobium sp. B2-4-12]UCI32648.1 DUF3237 domain-containing protein [Mesorhizobium sp. B4-1-4]
MNFEFEFTLSVPLNAPIDIGPGPFGMRRYFEISDGTIVGKKLNGKILPGGGDWALIGPDGFFRLDVRTQLVTNDGAFIYLYYPGLIELNETVTRALATGGSTEYGDHYLRSTPRFETGDPRYAWLNQSLFVAEGRLSAGALEYKIYRVA